MAAKHTYGKSQAHVAMEIAIGRPIPTAHRKLLTQHDHCWCVLSSLVYTPTSKKKKKKFFACDLRPPQPPPEMTVHPKEVIKHHAPLTPRSTQSTGLFKRAVYSKVLQTLRGTFYKTQGI
jgi:hypothetical protein